MEKNRYSDKYYKRHFIQYREWENKIGEYIFNVFNTKSVLDLGCGVGSYLEGLYISGCKDLLGIELNFNNAKKYLVNDISSFVIEGDVTKEINLDRKFDCVISFEVGEHINPNGMNTFINNITSYANKYIIFTAAGPGQRGTGHINLTEKKIWIKEIVSKGFLYKKHLVKRCKIDWKEFNVASYIIRNLMIFKREKWINQFLV